MPSAPPHINADYTAAPLKRTLLNALYGAVALAMRLFLWRRIERIVGLENLPERGPFMIVANHLSYMDDFLLAYVVRRYCGEKLYIPTNKKAFRGAVTSWLHLAGGAVEVDPADRTQSYGVVRRLVDDGKIIVMFPEGTRSDGTALLPFRFGTFNLARECGVKMVPAALVDTHRVLPKHRWLPTRSARASVCFLAAMPPSVFDIDDVGVVKERCRGALADELWAVRRWMTSEAAHATACHLARRAEAAIESLIERGPETIRRADLRPVFGWVELSRYSEPDSYAIEVQHVRAWGFRVLATARPIAPFFIPRLHALGARALRRDPRQPFLHYVHGQFHLRAPWIAGGRRRRARAALGNAYRWASRYGVDRTRFAISYAEALAKDGRKDQALRVLERDFAQSQPACDRTRRRAQRAAALAARLRGPSAAPATLVTSIRRQP